MPEEHYRVIDRKPMHFLHSRNYVAVITDIGYLSLRPGQALG